MTQAQASMQKCLVVFACAVEISHQPSKARAIEVHECDLNVVPGWRGILATDHGHESFKDGFMREHDGFMRKHIGWFKIHAFQKAHIGGMRKSHQWHMLSSP